MNQRFSTNFAVVSFFIDWTVAFGSIYAIWHLLGTRYQLGVLEPTLKINALVFPLWRA